MNLKIVSGIDTSVALNSDEFVVTAESLKFNATHLFLASRSWDTLTVTLTDDIPLGVLQYIKQKVKTIECIINIDTDTTMKLLCELFPEISGKIRKQFLMGRPLNELLH